MRRQQDGRSANLRSEIAALKIRESIGDESRGICACAYHFQNI